MWHLIWEYFWLGIQHVFSIFRALIYKQNFRSLHSQSSPRMKVTMLNLLYTLRPDFVRIIMILCEINPNFIGTTFCTASLIEIHSGTPVCNLLRVSRSRNKIVELQILPKNKPMNLFFYPDDLEILKTLNPNSSLSISELSG